MGKDSSIQWTDHTWPITSGCDDASPGCLHCYAKPASYRMGLNPNPKVAAAYGGTVEKRAGVLRWTGTVRTLPERLDWPFKWKKPARIFVGNMSDLFHPDVPDEFIDRAFAVMALNPRHTFQVLTKRAGRMAEWITPGLDNREHAVEAAIRRLSDGEKGLHPDNWPLPNVWLGVSVEDQRRADERIPHLLRCPAAVRFLSVEPMLEAIEFSDVTGRSDAVEQLGKRALGGIDWVIVGGESGPRARPFDLAWARSIRDQCQAAGAVCFVKQLGSHPVGPYDERMRMIGQEPVGTDDVVRWKLGDSHGGELMASAVSLKDPHGGDESEFPVDLRGCRAFPRSEAAHV